MQIKTFYETNFNFIRPLNYLNAISNATYELHAHILLICAIQLSFEKKWALLVTYQNVDFLSRLSKLSRILSKCRQNFLLSRHYDNSAKTS